MHTVGRLELHLQALEIQDLVVLSFLFQEKRAFVKYNASSTNPAVQTGWMMNRLYNS